MIPYKITLEEYHQMRLIFLDSHLELIEGELFDMAPIGTPVGDYYQTVTTPNVLAPLAFPELNISLEDILP